MTVVAADFDEDGWTDIFVACDSTPSLLFMNNHDGTFREEGVLRGVALSEDGMEQAGMGVGIGDYIWYGHLDLFKTHFIGDTPAFTATMARAISRTSHRRARTGRRNPLRLLGYRIRRLRQRRVPDVLSSQGTFTRKLSEYWPTLPKDVRAFFSESRRRNL